jgi:hypothetical protein
MQQNSDTTITPTFHTSTPAAGTAGFPGDIYTEPANASPDTLANLGPLRAMAGIWESDNGTDIHPVAAGTEENRYVEHIELQPIDPQTNGPQLFYGLRYHTHVVKPGQIETFHDQVGYWLWEPATKTVIHMLAIPRAQVLMASGTAKPDATEFELRAERGSMTFGICSGPFLDEAFRTSAFTIKVSIHPDGRWSYEEDSVMTITGRTEPFHHTDKTTLKKIAEPTPNPKARKAK